MMMEPSHGAGCSTPPCKSPNGAEQDGLFMKTSPVCSAPAAAQTLLPWLAKWLEPNLISPPKQNGKQVAFVLVSEDLSNGLLWMRNTAEHRSTLAPSLNGGGVSSLSEILETGQVAPRYFLTPKACAGILRRAEKRGKKLPEQLANALLAVAQVEGQKELPQDTPCLAE